MAEEQARLRGWKSIAGHLRVAQSTAIRWARDPEFPVIRTGTGGSVYAYADSLDLWLARGGGAGDLAPSGDAPMPADPPEPPVADKTPPVADETPPPVIVDPPASATVVARRPPRSRLVVAGLAGLALLAGGAAFRLIPAARTPAARMASPDAARQLLEARTQWAARTPAGLARATAMFQAIIARHPDYAPAFAGLADSYLLSCEFDAMPRDLAFARARAAVATAVALAPTDPDAQRVTGFIDYWTSRDIAAAAPHFEAAIADRRASYLPYLWYGNALVDAGRVDRCVAMLEQALAMAPDSPVVLTDYAVALWQAGDETASLRQLEEVRRRFPDHSSAPGMSALYHLARGEAAAYLVATERWAALIGDPAQIARVGRARQAFDAGGREALLRAVADAPTTRSPFWHGGNLPAAIAASVLGDRDRLVAILSRPAVLQENWRRLHFPAAAFDRWRGDSRVAPLLDRAFSAPPSPPRVPKSA